MGMWRSSKGTLTRLLLSGQGSIVPCWTLSTDLVTFTYLLTWLGCLMSPFSATCWRPCNTALTGIGRHWYS